MARTSDTVDSQSLAYRRMAEKWRLIDDLCGGTQAMRAAGPTWLPRETKEKVQDYNVRLERSILYSALADTIDKTAARPFSKPISLQMEDRLPEQLQDIEEDADRQGTSLTEYARSCFVDGLKYGKFHVLADFPAAAGPRTLKDETDMGLRPYFCRVSPTDVIGWTSEKGPAGNERLTMVRIRECRVEPDGKFGEKEVEYVRVLMPGSWELWRKTDDNGEWALYDEGPNSLGAIPLVTVYFNKTAYMESDPTFEDLAWLNLAHWQSYSDQRNLLRVARVPILSAVGLSQTEYDQGITVSTSNLLKSTNPDAKFGYVEHSGSALGAGDNDLKSLEERMEVLGLQPLISRSGGVTATAKSMDEARTESNIQAWIRATEHGLWKAYEWACKWIGAEMPEDFSVDIYSDFGLTMKSAEDMQTLLGLYAQGVITARTLLNEIKRRGVLGDMVDVDEEAQAAEDEAPRGLMGALGEIQKAAQSRAPQDQPATEDDEAA